MERPGAQRGQSRQNGQGLPDGPSGQIVCFETFRLERQRRQARVLPYLAPAHGRSPRSPFGHSQLTRREIEHRHRMLRHLSEPPLFPETSAK